MSTIGQIVNTAGFALALYNTIRPILDVRPSLALQSWIYKGEISKQPILYAAILGACSLAGFKASFLCQKYFNQRIKTAQDPEAERRKTPFISLFISAGLAVSNSYLLKRHFSEPVDGVIRGLAYGYAVHHAAHATMTYDVIQEVEIKTRSSSDYIKLANAFAVPFAVMFSLSSSANHFRLTVLGKKPGWLLAAGVSGYVGCVLAQKVQRYFHRKIKTSSDQEAELNKKNLASLLVTVGLGSAMALYNATLSSVVNRSFSYYLDGIYRGLTYGYVTYSWAAIMEALFK
jgi:hypothetical protein